MAMKAIPEQLSARLRNPGLVLAALLVVVSAALFVWDRTSRANDPDLLWKAVEAGLTTDGVTCRITDTEQERTSDQSVTLDLKQRHRAVSLTTIRDHDAVVKTEGITTKSAEYIRYLAIDTGLKNSEGKALDFSNVIGQWGKQSVEEAKPTSLYGQTVLGGCIVPLADVSADKKAAYGAEFRKGKIFEANTAVKTTKKVDGQTLRAYRVTVQPEPYIRFMTRLAEERGLKDLSVIDIEQYAGRPAEQITMLVDPASRQIRMITFEGQQREIRLSEYGKRPKITEPSKTIPMTELQQRLQNVK